MITRIPVIAIAPTDPQAAPLSTLPTRAPTFILQGAGIRPSPPCDQATLLPGFTNEMKRLSRRSFGFEPE